jgi:two-component system cell cycle response regulator
MTGFEDPEIYRTLLEALKTGLCVVDRQRKIVFWNDGAQRTTGYLRHEVVGHSCVENLLQHCDGKSCELCGESCPLTAALHDAKPMDAMGFVHHKGGHRIFVHTWTVPVRDKHGSVIGAMQCFEARHVVPSLDRRRDSTSNAGFLDPVSGVANHAMMQSHLRETLATFRELGATFGVLGIQLGRLAEFRAKYGSEATNSMLRVVAQTLENSLRPSDFVGRWAEDQFLAILTNCNISALDAVSERVLKMAGSGGIEWWGRELHFAVTIAKTVPQAEDTLELLQQRVQESFAAHLEQESSSAAAGSDSSRTS